MTRDEQAAILELFPESVSWSNTKHDASGLFRYNVYGAFIPVNQVNDVMSLIDTPCEVQDFGQSYLIRGV